MIDINEFLGDIEFSRTREELKAYIENKYEIIKGNDELISLLQLKKARFKEFREELIPIANFSYSSYAMSEARYKIIIGNQKYDGTEESNGNLNKIEVTSYFDGKEENDLMKSMINNNGIGTVPGKNFFKERREYFKKFRENVEKKLNKKYFDTKIIFVIPNEIEGIIRPDLDEKIEDLIARHISIVRDYHFIHNELYILKPTESLIDVSGESIVKINA